MHSVRHKARQAAWRMEQDGENYNPFRRSSYQPPRRRLTGELEDFHSPDRVNTEPTPTSPRLEVPDERLELSNEVADKVDPVPATLQHHQTEPLEVIVEKPEEAIERRKRRRFHLIHRKTSGDIDEEESVEVSPCSPPSIRYQLQTIFTSYLIAGPWEDSASHLRLIKVFSCLMFAFVPAGFAVNYAGLDSITVFTVNFMAIFPSSGVLGLAVEQTYMNLKRMFKPKKDVTEKQFRTADILTALLNMTFSNAVQLISSILLLVNGQVNVLKISLLGVMLSNLLLMTGLGFFLGGVSFHRLEQYFDARVAQTIGMLLLLAVLSLVVPTAAHLMTNMTPAEILSQSRGVSLIILVSYLFWMYFQLGPWGRYMVQSVESQPARTFPHVPKGLAAKEFANIGAATAAAAGGFVNAERNVIDSDEDEEVKPDLGLTTSVITLLLATVLVGFNTQFATDSIQGLLIDAGLTINFIGIVILPLLSLDPLSIKMAIKDEMDMSISLTLEKCMQTALMIIPLVMILGWILGKDDMTLEFDGFIVVALFASIIIVTYVVQEGKSNWLTGALLIKVFVIIAVTSYYLR